MKWILVIFLSGLAIFGIVKENNHSTTVKHSFDPFAVLELFTSEGCSSCPPADRLLPQLADLDPKIIPLSLHVDYWDHLGWKDPFGSSAFSERQQEYGHRFNLKDIYTPQLVINGEYELVGSNKSAAETDIRKLLKEKATVQIRIDEVKNDKGGLSVTCRLQGDWQQSNILTAVVQKHAEINIKAGENRGIKLSHTNIVRTFTKQEAKENLNFVISYPADLNRDNFELVIFTQQRKDFKITGAALYQPAAN